MVHSSSRVVVRVATKQNQTSKQKKTKNKKQKRRGDHVKPIQMCRVHLEEETYMINKEPMLDADSPKARRIPGARVWVCLRACVARFV